MTKIGRSADAGETVLTQRGDFFVLTLDPAAEKAVESSFPDHAGQTRLLGDVAAADQCVAQVLAIIDERLTSVMTPERERILGMFRKVALEGGRLPRGGLKYHLRATLALADVSFRTWVEQAALREDVDRIAPLLPIDDMQAVVHERGGPRAESIIGLARKTMDEMEISREVLPRESLRSYRPSVKAFAKRMGVELSVIYGLSLVKRELSERVKIGRIELGAPYFDPHAPSRAERRAAREALKKLLVTYVKLKTPIAASSQRADRIDLDWLLDEAAILDRRLRDCMKCDPLFRHALAEVIRKVRLKPVHLSRIDPGVVSYERLEKEGDQSMREMYRRENPNPDGVSTAEEGWMANQRSFLKRLMKVASRSPVEDAAADFAVKGFADVVATGRTGSVKGDAAYDKSIERWRTVAKALMEATVFPASFAGALDAAMVAVGRDAPSLSAEIGCKRGLIHAWRRGSSLPTFQNFHLIGRLEVALGLVEGTLSKRVPSIRSSRTITGGRKEITLEDGRVLPLAGLWRYMHPDAPIWPEDRLRVHVEETHARVFGVDTPHRVRQRAAMTNAYNLPEPDPISPIWKEMDDLVGFQTGMIDDGRLRNPLSEWNSEGTVKLHRSQITTFVRWLMLPVAVGGLGIAPELISFSLLINYKIVLRYVTWRVLRAADLEVNGERIGPKITATEKMLLFFFANLLDPEFGWVTQSRGVLKPLQAIDTTFRMPFIRSAKQTTEIVDDDTCLLAVVMPPEIVASASTEEGWRNQAAAASAHIRSTGARFSRSFRLIRDPQQLIMPILRHQHPIGVGLRMVRDALANVRPIATSPYLHASDVQRALAFLLLMLVVFRSGTMRNLTWRADGTGNVRKTIEGWEIVVGADNFKNGFSPELFGPTWNRRDYERTLGDWGDFGEVIEHFITKCRPILLGNRESDLLFPPPKGRTDWSESNFNYLVMSFTRKWCVYNPRYGTGMSGVRAFGPHPARNIVATHIVRNHPNEDRWRLASIILQTGIEKVKLRYGWVTTREELAKTDDLYAEASKLAASNADLY